MINIKVDGQHARKINNPVIAADAVNFVRLKAEFSEEWNGLSKSYIFTHVENELSIQVESDADTVLFPHEVLLPGTVTVGIKGTKLAEDGSTLEVRATHAALSYIVSSSGLSDNIANSDLPTATVSEQLRGIIASASPLYFGSSVASVQTGTSTAGGKGFKVLAVSETDSDTGTYTLSSVTGLQTGMEYAVNLASSYYGGGVITTVDGSTNTITVSGYHYTPLSTKGDNPDNFEIENYLVIPSRPDLGDTDIGFCANASGMGSIAQDKAARASGCDNVAAGKYADINGYKNKGGFCDHVEGYVNTAYGTISHVEGTTNTESGSGNHVEGRGNTVNGYLSTVAGGENTVTGNLHDVSGQDHVVTGHRNTVRGQGHVPSGYLQTVIGQYAENDTDKAFILGWGSGKSSRKNIATVDRYGNLNLTGSTNTSNITFSGTINGIAKAKLNDDIAYFYDNDYIYKTKLAREFNRWFTVNNNTVEEATDGLKITPTTQDPQIVKTFFTPIKAMSYGVFAIKYKMEQYSGSSTNLPIKCYYTTTADPYWGENKTFILGNAVADDNWHIAKAFPFPTYLDSTNSVIDKLRIDLPNTAETYKAVYIRYIGFFDDEASLDAFDANDDKDLYSSLPTVDTFKDGDLSGKISLNSIALNAYNIPSLANRYTAQLSPDFMRSMKHFYNGRTPTVMDCLLVQNGAVVPPPQNIYLEVDYDNNEVTFDMFGGESGYSFGKAVILLG